MAEPAPRQDLRPPLRRPPDRARRAAASAPGPAKLRPAAGPDWSSPATPAMTVPICPSVASTMRVWLASIWHSTSSIRGRRPAEPLNMVSPSSSSVSSSSSSLLRGPVQATGTPSTLRPCSSTASRRYRPGPAAASKSACVASTRMIKGLPRSLTKAGRPRCGTRRARHPRTWGGRRNGSPSSLKASSELCIENCPSI